MNYQLQEIEGLQNALRIQEPYNTEDQLKWEATLIIWQYKDRSGGVLWDGGQPPSGHISNTALKTLGRRAYKVILEITSQPAQNHPTSNLNQGAQPRQLAVSVESGYSNIQNEADVASQTDPQIKVKRDDDGLAELDIEIAELKMKLAEAELRKARNIVEDKR